MMERVTRSEAETAAVARELAGTLRPGSVLLLSGNLGAGKTAFVRGLAEGLGLDPELLFDAVADGPLDMGYLRAKGRAMIDRNFEPSFSLRLAAKDARLVEESAGRRGMELPLLTAVRRQLDAGVDEHGDADLSAAFLGVAPRQPA